MVKGGEGEIVRASKNIFSILSFNSKIKCIKQDKILFPNIGVLVKLAISESPVIKNFDVVALYKEVMFAMKLNPFCITTSI